MERKVEQIANARQLNQAINKENRAFRADPKAVEAIEAYMDTVDIEAIKNRVRYELRNGVDVKFPKIIKRLRLTDGTTLASDDDTSSDKDYDIRTETNAEFWDAPKAAGKFLIADKRTYNLN